MGAEPCVGDVAVTAKRTLDETERRIYGRMQRRNSGNGGGHGEPTTSHAFIAPWQASARTPEAATLYYIPAAPQPQRLAVQMSRKPTMGAWTRLLALVVIVSCSVPACGAPAAFK